MENKINEYKIILACNKKGMVKRIFLDTGSLLENMKLPVGLHSIISTISIKNLGNFWISIQESSIAENILLTLNYNEKQHNFIFSGYLLGETVLLCGNTELKFSEKALEEMMRINNEQTNQVRIAEKKVGSIVNENEKKEMNEVYLNDFSSLNNELINNKRELMRKNQKIELLNKELNDMNEHMTMFTYSVSHDLKEPVRMVKSYLTLFQKKYGGNLDGKGQTYIDMALDGANRLSNMMSDLLQYHQSFNLITTESVDLNKVFLEVKHILRNEISTKNALITSEKLPVINGSYTGYFQVLQNLISNAIKFVPDGITPIVSVHVTENDLNYTFRVKDNGIGIAENKSQKVFQLFSRLNSPKEFDGTGMGLAMVRKSIERMGGEIWLESEEGEGSSFYFTIRKSIEA